MFFHAATFARSRGRCWKPRPKAAVFNTSKDTWRMSMHWKIMFDRCYCIKTENTCYIPRCFLHYFVSPAPDVARTLFARTMPVLGQGSTHLGTAAILWRAYWKLRSRGIALFIHGFSPVNAWLLITCDTAFYAIIHSQTCV